ncbi:MAG: SurA N-terminal domain-containing protein [Spirochaetes bacterium]|nr:SurA N-terminal domain-containing protein [Spirochaetota bacterium]
MFDSKSPVIKVGGYIIVGLFTLLIVVSFGMPDFMSKIGVDENVVAIVNGEKIYRLDFLRYRDNMSRQIPDANKKEMQDQILNSLIMRKLMLQKIEDIGIRITDERVMENIKSIPFFKNKDGKFDKSILERYLNYNHLALPDFFLTVKEDLLINEFRHLVITGIGVSPNEVKTDYAIEKSQFQIKYCHISAADLDKRYKKDITVTEREIDDELQKSQDEIKDPKTDRKRIRDKLERQKLNKIKSELIAAVDKLAAEKKSFNQAASVLKGNVMVSEPFRIGDPVKSRTKGKMLHSISNSSIFTDSLSRLESGQTSKVIDSFDGIYIFTPVKKNYKLKDPEASDYDRIQDEIANQVNNSVYISMMTSLREESRIIKNLKFN